MRGVRFDSHWRSFLFCHISVSKEFKYFQRPLSSLPTHSVGKGPPTHPIPKSRIVQGRARLRRKVKTNQPIPLSQQTPAQPITTHVPKTAPSLPERITQSQVNA